MSINVYVVILFLFFFLYIEFSVLKKVLSGTHDKKPIIGVPKSFAVKWLRENYNQSTWSFGLIIQTIIYEAVMGIKFTKGVVYAIESSDISCYRKFGYGSL